MDIVEHNLDGEPDDLAESLLARPLFCFVGMLSTSGTAPRISPLWFLWEDEALWILGDTEESHTTRLEHDSRVAVAIVDFDASSGQLQHLGLRGTVSFEPYDEQLAFRLLSRYLGDDPSHWDPNMFTDPRKADNDRWTLLRIEPETAVVRDFSYDASSR